MLHQLGGWKWMLRERGSECWFKWVHPLKLLEMTSFRILWCDELLPCQQIHQLWFLHNAIASSE